MAITLESESTLTDHFKTISPEWVERIQSLVRGVEVDFDAPLSAADE